MKILLAAASFASNISGIQRHALSLARCLLLRPEVSALHLVVSPWQSDFAQIAGLSDARLSLPIADISHSPISRNLWYYRRLPELAAQLQADIVHLSFPVPCNASAFNCPTIVTLHDMYPYEIPMNFGFPKFILNRAILQQCIRSVDAIACVSDATQNRLKRYAPPSVWKKAVRIYNCVEPEPVSAAESPIPNWKNEPFLLCVAQHRRNKNITTLIRSFHRLLRSGVIEAGFKLVVVGIRGPESGNIERLVTDCGLNRQPRLSPGSDRTRVAGWCYRNCAALCRAITSQRVSDYPSLKVFSLAARSSARTFHSASRNAQTASVTLSHCASIPWRRLLPRSRTLFTSLKGKRYQFRGSPPRRSARSTSPFIGGARQHPRSRKETPE